MAIFLLLLLAVSCYGMRFSSFHEDHMSVRATTAIKGVFAIIILLSHTKAYISLGTDVPDRLFGFTMRYLGQLMVTAYFFYSGFGILESVRHKKRYMQGFFKKRFLKTLIHFDLAVLLFLVLQSILGNHFESADYLWCWIGWESIGNSCWFIFVILALYLATYLAFRLFPAQDRWIPTLIVTLLSAGLWVFLHQFKQDYWWYDTLAAFPAGMWFSIAKEKYTGGSLTRKTLLAVAVIASFVIWRHFVDIDIYGICAILFSLTVVAFSLWVKLDNPVLQWLGKHCFSIYMLQRIPMIVLSQFGMQNNKFVFTTVVIVTALLLAWGFTKATDALDTKLFA